MERVRHRAEWWVLAGGGLAALALGHSMLRLDAEAMPQIPCENILVMVLGDARQQLSQVLFDKVEEYFHGGVRGVVCEHGLGHAEEASAGHVREPHAEARPAGAASGTGDPWAWLNARLHVQEDRHLENEKAVELLPWIWASCRTSPKNTQAFLAGSYVLARMVGRPEEGVRLLEEGVRKNPACAELDFSLGEMYLSRLKDAGRAEQWFLSARDKWRPAEESGDDDAESLRMRTLFYLGYLAKRRGDVSGLRAYASEAEKIDPQHVCAKDLRALLKSAEAAAH